nr:hypothetical protein GCM10020093_099820 [Planobispora longispora]
MPVARTRCVCLIGVTGHVIDVEADVGHGMAGTHFIGMLDTALSEARDRVRSAVVNSHHAWPDARITVSLFPASLPKRGSAFDLAIAVALLAAAGAVPRARIADPFFLGELGLDGSIRPVRGVLPAVLSAAAAGARTVVVPARNAAEARLVPDLTVIPVTTLGELVGWLRSDDPVNLPTLVDELFHGGPGSDGAAGPGGGSGPSGGSAPACGASSFPGRPDASGGRTRERPGRWSPT